MKRFAFWILHSKETQHVEDFGILLINLEFGIQMESFAFWIFAFQRDPTRGRYF